MTDRAPSVVMSSARAGEPHLTVAGEVDGPGAVRLRALIEDAARPGARISLDLSRVTHLSSEALAVLVHGYRRLRDSGGTLQLAGVSPAVARVLRVSGLDRVLPVQAPAPALPVAQALGS